MASPQTENGYTKIANEIMEALARNRLSGQERQIVDVVLRKTYGFNKKEDVISMGQFSKLTGINRPLVARLLKSLLHKMILRVTQKDNTKGNSYIFQKDFEKWRVLHKKITVTQKDNTPVTQNDNKSVTQNDTYKRKKETLTKEREHTFTPFYEKYPKKKGKQDALRAWTKLSPDNTLIENIMTALEVQKKSEDWLKNNGQYVPLPASWLNGRRWEDEITAAPKKWNEA